jgi:beta-galactosidase GanA
MMQMVAENKSLWRIQNNYHKDADCKECQAFWDKMEKDKEDHIRELSELIKNHMK